MTDLINWFIDMVAILLIVWMLGGLVGESIVNVSYAWRNNRPKFGGAFSVLVVSIVMLALAIVGAFRTLVNW